MKITISRILLSLFLPVCALAAPDYLKRSPALDSKLASYFDIYSTMATIDARAETASRRAESGEGARVEIVKARERRFVLHVPSESLPAGIRPRLLVEVANRDLVIKGIPLEGRSLPIADRTFLFSQYAIRVEEVLSPGARGIAPGDIIVVARPGGTLMVGDVFVEAIEPNLELFQLGEPYYFFLIAIPDTDVYRALGSGTYSVRDGMVVAESKLDGPEPALKESDFLVQVRLALLHATRHRK